MSAEKRYTLADFTPDLTGASAQEEWRGSWATALLSRRPGLLVALWAARRGLAPSQITYVAFLVAVSLPIFAAFLPLGLAAWVVALLGFFFQVLDCADGTLARTTAQASKRGGDLDFLVDMAQWGLLYAAIGILADRTLETGFGWTALAITAAWVRLLARVVRDTFHTSINETYTPPKTALDHVIWFISGLSGLLTFLALTGPWLGWAVVFLLIYALLDIGEGALPLLRK